MILYFYLLLFFSWLFFSSSYIYIRGGWPMAQLLQIGPVCSFKRCPYSYCSCCTKGKKEEKTTLMGEIFRESFVRCKPVHRSRPDTHCRSRLKTVETTKLNSLGRLLSSNKRFKVRKGFRLLPESKRDGGREMTFDCIGCSIN